MPWLRKRGQQLDNAFPHSSCHLCYDGVAHAHIEPERGREDTGWTLSRWWIR